MPIPLSYCTFLSQAQLQGLQNEGVVTMDQIVARAGAPDVIALLGAQAGIAPDQMTVLVNYCQASATFPQVDSSVPSTDLPLATPTADTSISKIDTSVPSNDVLVPAPTGDPSIAVDAARPSTDIVPATPMTDPSILLDTTDPAATH